MISNFNLPNTCTQQYACGFRIQLVTTRKDRGTTNVKQWSIHCIFCETEFQETLKGVFFYLQQANGNKGKGSL